jgi:predicted ATPase
MFSIHSIDIDGFRGREEKISLTLKDDVNFFIGRNGTGKTTLMNLLSSSLNVDVSGLSLVEFSSVVFRLRRVGDRRRPYVMVSRSVDGDGDPRFLYTIAMSSKAKAQTFTIHTSRSSSSWAHMYNRAAFGRIQPLGDTVDTVIEHLSTLVNFSWISVHRGVSNQNTSATMAVLESSEKSQTPVDRKLTQVATDFVTYFSTLDKKAAEETDKFQQVYLLALISPSGFDSLTTVKSINVDDEKSAIRGMFAEFNIKSSVYNTKLESFTKRMTKAVSNYKPNKGLAADDFLVLTDTVRIHDAVKEWHKLLDERAKIYKPKDDFVGIVNDLFYRKTLSINRGNQPYFTDAAGKPMKLDDLSSGEKQLFILLGETLLQQRTSCIFMADEPEISLHIDWQERLVPSLLKINPNAQIVFATHSPDVVGAYSDAAIDLEKII